ncbi:MAG: CARDB domain-containing protein [Methanobacteriota archaeon]
MTTLSGHVAQKRVICLGIVLCLVVPGLLGMAVGSKEEQPEIQGIWDEMIIDAGDADPNNDYFNITEYMWSPITENYGIYYADRSIIVRNGGQLRITNATLDFTQDNGLDGIEGTSDDHHFKLTVDTSSTLLMSNATIVTDARMLHPYVKFGMYVNDSTMTLTDNSVIAFPGDLQIRNTITYINDSWITNQDPSENDADYEAPGWLDDFKWSPIVGDEDYKDALAKYYTNLNAEDLADGILDGLKDMEDDCPVIRFFDCADVTIADSRIDNLYEQTKGICPPKTITTQVFPNSKDAVDTSGEPNTYDLNITDGAYYTLTNPPAKLGIDGFDTSTLPGWPIIGIDIEIVYDSTNYNYTNMPSVWDEWVNISIDEGMNNISLFQPSEDDGSLTPEIIDVFSLGVNTINIASSLDVYYKNCDDDGVPAAISFDKLILNITQIDPAPSGYISVDNSELSIMNSFIDVDYLNPDYIVGKDNKLRLNGTSNVYMYNVTVSQNDDGLGVDDRLELPIDPITNLPLPPQSPFNLFDATSQVFYYRWISTPVLDMNGNPVNDATVTAKGDYLNLTAINYIKAANNFTDGSSSDKRIIAYMDRISALEVTGLNYTQTDRSGQLSLPVITDIINTTTMPNSQFIGNYKFTATSGGFSKSIKRSFAPFPDIRAEKNSDALVDDSSVPLLVIDGLAVPLPDLIPGPVWFSNPAPDQDEGITIFAIIENVGSSTALNFDVLVEDISGPTTTTIFTQNYASLGAGSFINQSIPWTAKPSGTHYIKVTVDNGKNVYEGPVNSTEELNNTNSPGQSIYVRPFMPDLLVDTSDISITPPSNTVSFGTTLTVTAIIHNVGTANATGVPVHFYWGNLSWGGPDWNGDEILDVNASTHLIGTDNIDVGDGIWLPDWTNSEIQYAPPLDGTYRLYVWVDPNYDVPELVDEYVGNLASQQYIVQPKPNLAIAAADIVVGDPTPVQGVSTSITATVRNLGGVVATGTCDVVFALDSTSNVIGTRTVTDVPANGNQVVSINPWVPNVLGFHRIYVTVNAPIGLQTDNQAYIDIAIYNVSQDLIVNNANSPYYINGAVGRRGFVLVEQNGNLIINGSLAILQTTGTPFSIKVRESGSITLNGGSIVSANPSTPFYLEDNARLSASSGSYFGPNINIYASGANVIVNLNGTSVMGLFDSSTGSNVRMIAGNTTFTGTLNIRGSSRYDLTAVSASTIRTYDTATAYIYRWLTIDALDGQDLYPHSVPNVAIDLSYAFNDPVWAPIIHRAGTTGTNGKVSFAALSDILTPTVYPTSFFVGNYIIRATYLTYPAWENGTLALTPYPSLVTASNYPEFQIRMTGILPDLDPPVWMIPTLPGRGEQVTIWTSVSNANGITTAYDVIVRFRDETTGQTIGYSSPVDIAAGSVQNIAMPWSFDKLGNHTISVMVDPFDYITEFNENDNWGWLNMTVIGLADLAFPYTYDLYYSPAPYVIGHELTINANVHNIGDIPAIGFNVTFYNGTPSQQTRLGVVNVTILGNGNMETVSVDWTPRRAGRFNISVVIDQWGKVNETSTLNNNVTGVLDVLEYSDIYISDLIFDKTSPVENNTAVKVTARVHNLGGAPASSVIVRFYDGPILVANLIGPADTIAYLPSGIAGDADVLWMARTNDRERVHQITAVASTDIYEGVPGLSNQLTENFTVVDTRPDLTLNETDIVVLTEEIITMKGFQVNVTVHNTAKPIVNYSNGLWDADNVTVDLFDGDSFMADIEEYLANVTVYNFTIVTRNIMSIVNASRLGSAKINLLPANASSTVTIQCSGVNTAGDHNLIAILDGGWDVNTAYGLVNEFNETDNNASKNFTVRMPDFQIHVTSPSQGVILEPGINLNVAGEVINLALSTPASGVVITVILRAEGSTAIIRQTTLTSGSDGVFNGGLAVPADAEGQYTITLNSTNTEDVIVALQFETAPTPTPLWIYIVIIIIIVVAVVGGFTAYTYFVGIGKLVECGSCGAFIPDGAHKCPKCGIEFESETAKCSVCSAWIPIDAKKCPECGAEFTTGDEEGEGYEVKMRAQYDEMLGQIKVQAKKTLGPKMTDEQFQNWWKAQPTFITFDEWLREEEEMRKMGSKPCPQCGTPNNISGRVCHKCGTGLKAEAPKGKMPTPTPVAAAKPTAVPAPATAPKETKKCPNCNMQVDVKEPICPVCGNDFERKSGTPPQPQQRAPSPQPVAAPQPPVQQPPAQQQAGGQPGEPRPVVKKIVRTPMPMQRVVVKKPGEEEKKEGGQQQS